MRNSQESIVELPKVNLPFQIDVKFLVVNFKYVAEFEVTVCYRNCHSCQSLKRKTVGMSEFYKSCYGVTDLYNNKSDSQGYKRAVTATSLLRLPHYSAIMYWKNRKLYRKCHHLVWLCAHRCQLSPKYIKFSIIIWILCFSGKRISSQKLFTFSNSEKVVMKITDL